MAQPSVDECLRVLANAQRRRVLEYLRRQGPREATLEELAAHLQSYPDAPTDRLRGQDRGRVVLVQMHLPQLSDTGIVDWNRDRERVRYRQNEVVEAVLDALGEVSVPAEV